MNNEQNYNEFYKMVLLVTTANIISLYFHMFNRMCREAIHPQLPPSASVEVRSAFKKYNSSAIVLRGVSLTVRRNTMYE